VPVDIDPTNIPVILLYNVNSDWTQEEKDEVITVSSQLGHALIEEGHPTVFVPIFNDNIESHLDTFNPLEHMVFNWCESLPGTNNGEWLVAKRMEILGFVFTGAGSNALALSQDKCRVKIILDQKDIPTPMWQIFNLAEPGSWDRFPAIVKPVNEHCSEGITPDSVVLTPMELKSRISYILDKYRQPALVEDFVDGREFHVTLWGNEHLEMLPPAEMDFSFFSDLKDRLCTYESKSIPGSDHYEKIETLLPAPLSKKEIQALEQVCKAAYRALGCRDYARLDVRYQNNVFFILDVNPNPDISHDASMACVAEFAGFSYGQMGSRIVRLAAKRHPLWEKKQPKNKERSKFK
jgi:D-alanine-D-alanine ligase